MGPKKDQSKTGTGEKGESAKNAANPIPKPPTDTVAVDANSAPEVPPELRLVPFVNPPVADQAFRRITRNMMVNFRVGVRLSDILGPTFVANQGGTLTPSAGQGTSLLLNPNTTPISIPVVSTTATLTTEGNDPIIPNSTIPPPSTNTTASATSSNAATTGSRVQLPAASTSTPAVKPESQGNRRKKRSRSYAKPTSKRSSKSGKEVVSKELFDVDKILDKRMRNGRAQYLLRWTGYSQDRDTWEYPEHMQCIDLIESFERLRNRDRAAKRRAVELLTQNYDSSSASESDSKSRVSKGRNDDSSSSKNVSGKGDNLVATTRAQLKKGVEKVAPPAPVGVTAQQTSSSQAPPSAVAVAAPTTLSSEQANDGAHVNTATTMIPQHATASTSSAPASSSMETQTQTTVSTVAYDPGYVPGIFPSVDLSRVDRNAPAVLRPKAILLTKVGQNGVRWYLVNWENYMYPFAWVGAEFMKTNFKGMVIAFYETMLNKYCPRQSQGQ